ncbi:MAG: GTPase HflX [Coriobacteriales bacterium]|jgi:GTP-binding protein HflX|nr:GTPase HflX [Coriobacteriales bacterium]
MTKEPMFETAVPAERALLVGIERPFAEWSCEESLLELERLVDTAGAEVVGTVTQRLKTPNTRTLVGKGKVTEIAATATALKAGVIIFDDELTPTQQSNLEQDIKGVKIIDRTALILDIFALHATSREGRLQVRLAQNQYLLPRLRGMWEHLASNRMGGGVGSRFGEGESQLEVDRRMVRKRIEHIRTELAKVQSERATQRKARLGSGIFRVALAGYTNAGKSSLLNFLTDANALVYDKLFATLDSTTRKLVLPDGREMTLTDTVGFIQKLPTTLVESFKSTLDEITNADLILHVVDASSPHQNAQMQAVLDTLEQIGAHGVPQVLVFNKCDAIDESQRELIAQRNPQGLFVSALTGQGSEELLARIEQVANAASVVMKACIPFDKGALVKLAHESCTVISEEYEEAGTILQLRVPPALTARFEPYVQK